MSGTDGMPDFKLLMEKGAGDLCAWFFDLLEISSRDIRHQPLVPRKAQLRELLIAAGDHVLRYSDEFADAVRLPAVAHKNGLEGVVPKSAISHIAQAQTSAGSYGGCH